MSEPRIWEVYCTDRDGIPDGGYEATCYLDRQSFSHRRPTRYCWQFASRREFDRFVKALLAEWRFATGRKEAP